MKIVSTYKSDRKGTLQLRSVISLFSLLLSFSTMGQETFPVNGVRFNDELYRAFINANIITEPGKVIKNGILLIQKEEIIGVGNRVEIPNGSLVIDLKGKYIYPSFIDPYSNYGIPELKKIKKGRSPVYESKRKGPYNWNDAVKPETDAASEFSPEEKNAEKLRKSGFGSVVTHRNDGIFRGTGAFVALSDKKPQQAILRSHVSQHLSFRKGTSTMDYPSSLMGCIALIRQTYYDALWYNSNEEESTEYNIALEAIENHNGLPSIFEVDDYQSALRCSELADEFHLDFIIKGGGDEYKNLNQIKASGATFIIPVDYPLAYKTEDPFETLWIEHEDLRHWESAPFNAVMLNNESIPFVFTAFGLEDYSDYLKNIGKTVSLGLPSEIAFAAMTSGPAKMLGVSEVVGKLKEGMLANFLITSDTLFAEDMNIYENWVQGKPFVLKDKDLYDARGNYTLQFNEENLELKVAGKADKLKFEVETNDTTKHKGNIGLQDNLVFFSYTLKKDSLSGKYKFSGAVNRGDRSWSGTGSNASGIEFTWRAMYHSPYEESKDKDSVKTEKSLDRAVPQVWSPNMAFGFSEVPKEENVLFTGATIWTNEKEGIIIGDVLVINGKIKEVGTSLTTPEGVKIIDVKGKHLTSGIIDEHSHIAISRGVNEGTQAVSAEVRIGDVINADDVNIYRQLAGGVTACQLLHGSANPIGGQSALIKLRWGKSANEMKIDQADGFIKFALGENVKQSNWGDMYKSRFPQSRMGVEQVFYNGFLNALEYDAAWKNYTIKSKKNKTLISPRRDLELEALAEIINKERFISCHSYVQSEINMLMKVADSMNFTLNTFTHILEGYKVADKMKAHGAGGSTFSDWWAYKFEVNDAIPYNGALLHDMGIVTAFNSDDAEMGRRLNQEAAKAIKYGGISEEDAWKFVTLNPAKLLHLDQTMGSIKPGKDADLVIWSDNPLSVNAKAVMTFVDGVRYFDLERDKNLRETLKAENARILEKGYKAIKNGDKSREVTKKSKHLYHCETMEDYGNSNDE